MILSLSLACFDLPAFFFIWIFLESLDFLELDLTRPTMLPLTLLRTAQNHPMLVELKNGETYNGHLVSCDNWMNINLREVICTSKDGDRFWRMPEVYIRGVNIKYLRIPDEVIDMVREEEHKNQRHHQNRGNRPGDNRDNKRPILNRGGGHQGPPRGAGGRGGGRGGHHQGGDRNGFSGNRGGGGQRGRGK